MKPLVISRKDAGVCLFLSLIAFAISALFAWASWHTASDAERMARSKEVSCEICDKTVDRTYAVNSRSVRRNSHLIRYFLDARDLQTGEKIKVEILSQDRFNCLVIGNTIHLRHDPVENLWFDPQSPRNPPRLGSLFWGCVFLVFAALSFYGLIHKRPAENKFFRFE